MQLSSRGENKGDRNIKGSTIQKLHTAKSTRSNIRPSIQLLWIKSSRLQHDRQLRNGSQLRLSERFSRDITYKERSETHYWPRPCDKYRRCILSFLLQLSITAFTKTEHSQEGRNIIWVWRGLLRDSKHWIYFAFQANTYRTISSKSAPPIAATHQNN